MAGRQRRPRLALPRSALSLCPKPADPSAPRPDERWNIIIVQLESVRGVDTGHLRPDRSPSPTPYLDSLAARPDAAVWTRGLTFGPPSINGRFALQCSITPSSRRFITSQTRTSFYCLSDALRRQGYRTEMFAAGDIDMDNSTVWVQRMYDKLWRYPAGGSERPRDLPPCRRRGSASSAARARSSSRSSRRATITPSARPSRSSTSPATAAVRERILNTSRYTDDVVRELIE